MIYAWPTTVDEQKDKSLFFFLKLLNSYSLSVSIFEFSKIYSARKQTRCVKQEN
jgi:hypothetical protein